MSGTDSDDTELLLLIPPNYYTETAERLLLEAKMSVGIHDAVAMPPPAAPTTASYQFLSPNKKSELHHINNRIQNIQLNDNDNSRFDAPSDISTISTSTVRTVLGEKRNRQLHGVIHSTPKRVSSELRGRYSLDGVGREENILFEIDNYLDENNRCTAPAWHQHHSDELLRGESRNRGAEHGIQTTAATSLPGTIKSQQRSASLEAVRSANASNVIDNKLISLSDLWGKSHLGGTVVSNIHASAVHSSSLKEEQLRRQHLEKTIHTLQSQLLEYQQRITVAIEVDRSKDAALATAEQATKNLNFEVQHLRDVLHKVESERTDYNVKLDGLQRELSQAVGLATKFQDKNDKLEKELDRHARQETELGQQLEQLQLQLHGCKHTEEVAHTELTKLRDKFAKMDYEREKLKSRIEELEKDNNTLRNQKEMLQDYHQKQKTRADTLETQRKSLQDTLANLTEIETNLKKKLETQQKALKLHYQQQLDHVVTQKLKEFQTQLDKTEEQLKTEARDRERLLADRAVKQLEMINEKNNLELHLVQEKHSEEVELYRLQLANASKKIDELELKLSCYKTKRADIAEKLHSVMEAQWQQALAILTSPNQTGQQCQTSDTDMDSPELNNARHYPDTPKTSKSQRSNNTEKNNLDMVDKRDPPSPMDKLQAYIELLLSKSPSDFEKLEEILALSVKQSKIDKSGKRYSNSNAIGKPPWKA